MDRHREGRGLDEGKLLMTEEGTVTLGIHFVREVIAELPEKSPARATLMAVIDRALRWELLGKDGQPLGQYSYFPRNEAGQGKHENPVDVLRIKDRHTGETHVWLGYGRWTTVKRQQGRAQSDHGFYGPETGD